MLPSSYFSYKYFHKVRYRIENKKALISLDFFKISSYCSVKTKNEAILIDNKLED